MKRRLVVLATAVCLLAVAALGTSSSSLAKSGGAPIKLMVMGTISSPAFSLPSIPVGAQIAVNEINSAGGVDGHKLDLITCNDDNDPNTATQCAREAIQDKVAALVGGLEDYDLEIEPALVAAHIPWVGLTSSDDFTSSNLFLLGGQGPDGFAAIGMALANDGCKNIAVIVSSAAGTQTINADDIAAGIHVRGANVATTIVVPVTTVDLSATVAAARAANADCIASGLGPSQSGPLITALAAGSPLPLGVVSGGLPGTVLQSLGAAANGVLASAGFLPATSKVGAVPKLLAAITAHYPNVPLDQFAETGYASVELVASAAKGLSQVTGSTLETALAKVKNFNTGVGPVVSFSKPSTIPGFPRMFNPDDYIWIAKNGSYVLDQSKPINATAALKLLSVK